MDQVGSQHVQFQLKVFFHPNISQADFSLWRHIFFEQQEADIVDDI